MMMRSLLPLLLGAVMLPATMDSAHANPFSANSKSSSGFLERRDVPNLSSAAFVVANHRTGEVISERNGNRVMPIASLTKLMTALVVLDANLRLNEMLTVTNADIDRIKGTGSRLAIGSRLSRAEMLHIALMSSENRAASALARHYPGGQRAFVEAMNAKARMLGMWNTRYADSTGLNPRNVSTAQDLAKLAAAAASYPLNPPVLHRRAELCAHQQTPAALPQLQPANPRRAMGVHPLQDWLYPRSGPLSGAGYQGQS